MFQHDRKRYKQQKWLKIYKKASNKNFTIYIWLKLWGHQKWALSTKKIFLPKCFQINSRKIHKISKRFDEKQKLADKRLRREVFWNPPLSDIGRFKEGNGFFSSICWFAGLCLWGRDFAVDSVKGIFQRFLAAFCRVPVK